MGRIPCQSAPIQIRAHLGPRQRNDAVAGGAKDTAEPCHL